MEPKLTPEQFCYWLKGFVEMNPEAMITHTQWLILKDHLNQVFKKETPLRISTLGEVMKEYDGKPNPFPPILTC